ncbi:MAG: IucA/IucC family protein, partial [Candidatus Pacebacteria bacterium]|nr:IucA/IucC family protein [Candidatus Paceibacterota bacterium]
MSSEKFAMSFRFLISVLLLLSTGGAWADSLSEWMLLEQTRINRTVDSTRIIPPDVRGQSQKYRPESQKWYPLKAVWVPEDELNVAIERDAFDPKISDYFVRTNNGKTEYRLLVHPESEKFYESFLKKYPVDATTFRATSTASSRTVLVQADGKNGPKFFAKLSLDVELAGVRRTIPQGEVARSVGTSMYLHDLESRIGTDRFTHMPEPFGISPKGWERGGMIVRQISDEIQRNETKLVPLFSLYSVDEKGKSLLQKLAAKAKLSPEDFVKRHILNPFYSGWVRWNLEGAVTMEAHAQNVLLELDSKNTPTNRFVHRDLGGF